jgi:hypothetical protein
MLNLLGFQSKNSNVEFKRMGFKKLKLKLELKLKLGMQF